MVMRFRRKIGKIGPIVNVNEIYNNKKYLKDSYTIENDKKIIRV